MQILKNTALEQEKTEAFLAESAEKIKTLEAHSECIDLSALKKIRENFRAKIDDFNREDRKLNIGIIGQVKAGKSTFLNTLLFNGRDVLPSARTPKTAVLTKIEYSETNSLYIEYYSADEWKTLTEIADSEQNTTEVVVAREIVNMARDNGINPSEFTSKKHETVSFESASDLMGRLNEYVGENGKYTPLVKSVTIMLDIPELKEISVVDTPGLNDAIASRTDKTKEFIEKCDVVFFLSRASAFLDDSDMKLITSQLPAKGVENLILVCSRFDDGIFDVWKKQSLDEAISSVKSDLTARAKEIMSQRRRESSGKIFEQCEEPVFVSSVCYNLSQKSESEYTRNEKWLYNKFAKKTDVTPELLSEIGNFDAVKKFFDKVVREKDATLQSKAANFIPNVKAEWKEALKFIIDFVKTRIQILETGDRETLQKQKRYMQSQISGIKVSLDTVLGDLMISLENAKSDNLRKIRQLSIELSKIDERTGEEYHVERYKVTTGHLWWKRSHYETSSYTTTYTYLAASDAIENIRNFGLTSCSEMEYAFQKAVDVRNVKRRLATSVLENFDTSDENFDINHFRHIIESTLNKLDFPIIKIDIEPFISAVSSKFSGEIKGSNERSELRNILASSINSLFEMISEQFTKEVLNFKKHICEINDSFADTLLENINDDFEQLQRQFEDKENEILKYREILSII